MEAVAAAPRRRRAERRRRATGADPGGSGAPKNTRDGLRLRSAASAPCREENVWGNDAVSGMMSDLPLLSNTAQITAHSGENDTTKTEAAFRGRTDSADESAGVHAVAAMPLTVTFEASDTCVVDACGEASPSTGTDFEVGSSPVVAADARVMQASSCSPQQVR